MPIEFDSASDQQATSSNTFVDVPGLEITNIGAGNWAAFFSCVLQPTPAATGDPPAVPAADRPVPCHVEFRITLGGVEAAKRALKIATFAPDVERVFTLEAKFATVLETDDVKVQWRVLYGTARIGDRRLTLIQ